MRKNAYINIEAEVIRFSTKDIITASGLQSLNESSPIEPIVQDMATSVEVEMPEVMDVEKVSEGE